MQEDQPSKTAHRVAVRRAIHQIWDEPRIFDDPLALKILDAAEAAEIAATKPSNSLPSNSLRAFIVARSRYAEDNLADSVQRNVKQYVILGAGLDTFACRNPFAGLRVFEVDFPATQEAKQKRLMAVGIPVPESLTFVPVNFEKDTPAEGLRTAGFNEEQPACFSWLGVVPYLAPETSLDTLRWVSSIPGSEITFDYTVPRSSLDFFNRMAFDALASRVAAAGEPFIGFFEPQALTQELKNMGFTFIEDLNGDDINARYFSNRKDNLRITGNLARLLCAQVQQAKTKNLTTDLRQAGTGDLVTTD